MQLTGISECEHEHGCIFFPVIPASPSQLYSSTTEVAIQEIIQIESTDTASTVPHHMQQFHYLLTKKNCRLILFL